MTSPALSIIIPANNESAHILPCLNALLAQTNLETRPLDVIVAANGCSDDTVSLAQSRSDAFSALGWRLRVLDIPEGSKIGALNAADAVAQGAARAYLDADIVVEPALVAQILDVLARETPVYATGRMHLVRAKSWVSRQYGALWINLPFMRPGSAPGAGFFAVNAAGRARWDMFPDIIADDGFIRWCFAPTERVEVTAGYAWPLVEGFRDLVKVRRRQNAGGDQLRRLYPHLEANDAQAKVSKADHLRLFLTKPVAYLVYVSVLLTVRRKAGDENQWVRGAR